MINCDIRTKRVRIGKANYVIILRHFETSITICYHCNYLGSTPAASTKFRESEIWCPELACGELAESVEGHALLVQKAL